MSKYTRDLYADWKDVANSFYDKSLSLAVLLLLFSFLVSPKIEVKPYVSEIKITEAVEIPPEIRERIEPPQELIRTVVHIEIGEGPSDDDDDVTILETIQKTTFDPRESLPPPVRIGETPKFVHYEDAPQALKRVSPEYPAFAKRTGIEGTVMLDVEVLKDGSIGAIEVVKSLMAGHNGLDEAAKSAVRQWQFTPAKSGGQPVAVWVRIPIVFSLE